MILLYSKTLNPKQSPFVSLYHGLSICHLFLVNCEALVSLASIGRYANTDFVCVTTAEGCIVGFCIIRSHLVLSLV
jgi:hypothetical protein